MKFVCKFDGIEGMTAAPDVAIVADSLGDVPHTLLLVMRDKLNAGGVSVSIDSSTKRGIVTVDKPVPVGYFNVTEVEE